jgi:hypothetical protein
MKPTHRGSTVPNGGHKGGLTHRQAVDGYLAEYTDRGQQG